jgi:hypothetical protein
MTLRRLLYLWLAAYVIGVPSSSAQSDPSAVAAPSKSAQQRIDLLLQRESEALDRYTNSRWNPPSAASMLTTTLARLATTCSQNYETNRDRRSQISFLIKLQRPAPGRPVQRIR